MTTSSDHELLIQFSKNGAHVFSAGTSHDLGTTGSFVKRVIRTRFGQARQFVFEISTSSPVKVPILAASIQAETDS
jgi:hypothetical protein